MKTRKPILTLAVLSLLLSFAATAQYKYVPKPNEEIYGTWINQARLPQKEVITAEGWTEYTRMTDSEPFLQGNWEIVSKWTDSEGNIWYKSLITITGGSVGQNGLTRTELSKLSKSAEVWEHVWNWPTREQGLRQPAYPDMIDQNNYQYGIFYRAKE